MTFAVAQPRYAKTAHPEEWLSILISLVGTLIATTFIWWAPGFEPTSGPVWTIPVWLALAYLLVQLVFLLISATQIRALAEFFLTIWIRFVLNRRTFAVDTGTT